MALKSIIASYRGTQGQNDLLEYLSKQPKTSGLNALADYIGGKEIGLSKAVRAKCCECMGYYVDGMIDCGVHTCSLYPWMPYKHRKPAKNGETA